MQSGVNTTCWNSDWASEWGRKVFKMCLKVFVVSHVNISGVYRELYKKIKENIQWAAVLWEKLPCWSQTAWRLQTLCRRASLNAHVGMWWRNLQYQPRGLITAQGCFMVVSVSSPAADRESHYEDEDTSNRKRKVRPSAPPSKKKRRH